MAEKSGAEAAAPSAPGDSTARVSPGLKTLLQAGPSSGQPLDGAASPPSPSQAPRRRNASTTKRALFAADVGLLGLAAWLALAAPASLGKWAYVLAGLAVCAGAALACLALFADGPAE